MVPAVHHISRLTCTTHKIHQGSVQCRESAFVNACRSADATLHFGWWWYKAPATNSITQTVKTARLNFTIRFILHQQDWMLHYRVEHCVVITKYSAHPKYIKDILYKQLELYNILDCVCVSAGLHCRLPGSISSKREFCKWLLMFRHVSVYQETFKLCGTHRSEPCDSLQLHFIWMFLWLCLIKKVIKGDKWCLSKVTSLLHAAALQTLVHGPWTTVTLQFMVGFT